MKKNVAVQDGNTTKVPAIITTAILFSTSSKSTIIPAEAANKTTDIKPFINGRLYTRSK